MSKLVSPWESTEAGEAWDRITVGGVLFTGKIDIEGTPWKKKHDTRHSRGRNGARHVATGWDLGEWTITLVSFSDETDAQLAAVIEVAVGDSPSTQDLHALTIQHPALLVKGITEVTFEEGDAPTPDGPGGNLVWKFKVKEYRPPEPRPVTRTPASAPQTGEARKPGQARGVYKTAAGPPTAPEMRPIAPPAPTADP